MLKIIPAPRFQTASFLDKTGKNNNKKSAFGNAGVIVKIQARDTVGAMLA
ncbi:MAG: hypothetical protein RIQ54_194 [Candidatus Parcubacteria bacterium]|jgi:hypothetical protein